MDDCCRERPKSWKTHWLRMSHPGSYYILKLIKSYQSEVFSYNRCGWQKPKQDHGCRANVKFVTIPWRRISTWETLSKRTQRYKRTNLLCWIKTWRLKNLLCNLENFIAKSCWNRDCTHIYNVLPLRNISKPPLHSLFSNPILELNLVSTELFVYFRKKENPLYTKHTNFDVVTV